jgi:hypothetical protein
VILGSMTAFWTQGYDLFKRAVWRHPLTQYQPVVCPDLAPASTICNIICTVSFKTCDPFHCKYVQSRSETFWEIMSFSVNLTSLTSWDRDTSSFPKRVTAHCSRCTINKV